ncbi:MAG: response regulator, partial [Deltaproteobacteria bacterium]|nr:response regulator [Deltaproteobacteria bacterium]
MEQCITDRFLADELPELLAAAGLGLWGADLSSMAVHCSPSLTRMTGIGSTTMPLDTFRTELVAPEDADRVAAMLERYLAGDAPRHNTVFRLRGQGRKPCWVEESVVVTRKDGEGKPLSLAGVLRDVTETMREADRLRIDTINRREAARQTGVGVWEWDVNNGTITCNNDCCAMFGFDPGDLDGPVGAVCRRMVHPDELQRVRQRLKAFVAGPGMMFCEELRLRHRDGRYIWVQETGVAVEKDEAGRAVRIIGGVMNIDSRINAEARLRETLSQVEEMNGSLQEEMEKAARRYQLVREASKTMFESNPHPNILFTVQGKAVDCNPVTLEVFGASSKEEFTHNFNSGAYEFPPQASLEGCEWYPFMENFRLAMEQGRSAFETCLAINGSPTAFDVICKRIVNEKTFVVAYLTDLTRIRRVQMELRKQSRLLHTINLVATSLVSASTENFDSMVHQAMRMIGEAADVDRVRVWRNHYDGFELCAREIFQWAKTPRWERPLIDKSSYDMLPLWWGTMMNRKPFNVSVEGLPDAERKMLEDNDVLSILSIPIYIRDEFWGFIGFDDCTTGRTFTESEEKLLQSGGNIIISALLRNEMTASLITAREQALSYARAKSEFLSRMSHEIRTPMNAIIGMGAIAKKTTDIGKIGECLRKIDASSRQLLGIINDILDMSKIDANRFEIGSAPFDFEKMLHNIFAVMQVKFGEKNQVFKYDIETVFTRKMISDELRLSQVLLNLLSNAVKFTPENGTIIMKIREKNREEAGSLLHIEVIDNGIGIPLEVQDKLFTSFEQGDGSITRRFGGTGLGLAISKKIVTLMGGDIWVKSAPNRGSAFIFEVPVGWDGELSEEVPPLQLKKELRALVVDDDTDVLEYMEVLLSAFPMHVDSTTDPMRAIDLTTNGIEAGAPHDVILVDWNLPVMNGVETALEIKRIAPDCLLIIMTPHSDRTEIEHEAGMFGITHILQKPILPSTLFDLLVQHTGRIMEHAPPPADPEVKDWSGKYILLAEDIEINQEIVLGILADTGVNIDIANDGLEAVSLFAKNPGKYDVVLMDVQMPNLDGLSATRKIRSLETPGALDVPIVAMTANAFKEDEENCRDAGMSGYLAKPIDVDALLGILADFFDNSADHQAPSDDMT